MIKIGELFDIEKGSVQSSKCIEGEYKFVTASEEWKTHNEYTHDCEALIFAMGASGSLGRTHYVSGKFVTSDLCFILTPKPKYKDKLNLRFYYYYFTTFREKIVSATATGTSKLAINKKIFSNHEIHFIDIDKQMTLIGKIENMREVSKNVLEEINVQEKYVAALRQAILQQAVEGKLCEQDPTDEPASVLLEKIKVKKEKLIAEKKIKKQKELPPITEEEKPFELPQGWEWCRLSNLGNFSSGSTPDMTNPQFWANGNVLWVTPKDMKSKYISESIMKVTNFAKENMNVYTEGTLLMVARSGILKRTLPLSILSQESTINQDLKAYSLFINEMSCFIFYLIKGLEQNILNNYTKQITTVDSLMFNEFSNEMLIPLPPLAEQQRIVEKVDRLMDLCDELEQEVINTKKYASQLMEAVLQEAFSNEEEKLTSNVIEFAPIQKPAKQPLLAAARGYMREDTWENLRIRALELAGEES